MKGLFLLFPDHVFEDFKSLAEITGNSVGNLLHKYIAEGYCAEREELLSAAEALMYGSEE